MCVTGFYLNPNPSKGSYKLVLVFNRDEDFNRPTQPAHWWPDSDIIAARDLQEGRVGGTWLGVSKAGRLSFLLNFWQPSGPDPNAKGRGFLVKDYLTGGPCPAAYTTQISKEGSLYNPFNLVCVDFSGEHHEAFYYSNKVGAPRKLEDGFHGISNSAYDLPWPKACYVKSHLESVVHSAQTEEALVHQLFDVFSKDQRLDGKSIDELDKAVLGRDQDTFREILPNLVMVKSPEYGTRSTTVFLVNDVNEAVFIERYLEDPIDINNPSWKTNEHRFTFGRNANL